VPQIFFYLFSALAVAGAIALVSFRNPVSCAMSMVASFVGLAALFIGLNAYFVGIIQILVYAGAIMVLFLFIIMLLDLKAETLRRSRPGAVVAAVAIPLLFIVQLFGVLPQTPQPEPEPLALRDAAEGFRDKSVIKNKLANDTLPDVHLVGLTLFGSKGADHPLPSPGFNFPLQIIGILLLVASVGVTALSRKQHAAEPPGNPSRKSPHP